MPKETLRISHGELSIPPWPVPLFGRVDIPVPDGFTDAAPLPDAAFAADSGRLICLVEFDWEAILSDSASEDVTRFPHPGIMRDGLPVEFFSHQLFDLDLADVDAVVDDEGNTVGTQRLLQLLSQRHKGGRIAILLT